MGAICHITPVLNDILDLCRFDLTYLTPPPPKFHRMHFVTLPGHQVVGQVKK